jgi:arylsulfatase A-like enzyme
VDWWNEVADSKFAYVQLGDLHEPLIEPERSYFGSIPNIEGISRWRFTSGEIQGDESEQYRFARELLYDILVRYVDGQINQTLDDLAEIDDTIIIITSDHGEEFWEYKEFEGEYFEDSLEISGVGHGHSLVPPVIEIPIATNIDIKSTSNSRKSLIDIVPTIL